MEGIISTLKKRKRKVKNFAELKKTKCNYYHEKGHWAKECEKKKDDKEKNFANLTKIFGFVTSCRNPSFGLATKAKELQGCGPRGRKPGSQGKGMAKVRAKKKPES